MHPKFFNLKTITILLLQTSLISTASANTNTEATLPVEQMQQFTRVLDQVRTHYVKEAEDKALFENAIRGMLAGLDPHSAYLNEEDYADLKVSTTGKFGGLGIEVTMEDGFIKVVTPIDDTPAASSGVKPGDIIIRLDDTPVKGLSLREAVSLMRGEKGSPIILTIVREGQNKPLEITVIRDIIKVTSTKHYLIEEDYGYVRVSHFQTSTAQNIRKAINKMNKKTSSGIKGLVLDLRNNPGGVLDGAVDVSEIFLNQNELEHEKLIVYTEGRLPSSKMREISRNGDMINNIPMVVLVNEGSASASEIVAGALQDHNRAVILGTNTFGKGSVQTVLPLSQNTGLKLTTAFYFTPSGRSIQAEGIVPDIEVSNLQITDEQQVSTNIKEADLRGHLKNKTKSSKDKSEKESVVASPNSDYQLYEAVNVLKGLVLMGS